MARRAGRQFEFHGHARELKERRRVTHVHVLGFTLPNAKGLPDTSQQLYPEATLLRTVPRNCGGLLGQLRDLEGHCAKDKGKRKKQGKALLLDRRAMYNELSR